MSRKWPSISKSPIVVAALALTASGIALADDSSMSVLIGDSYAQFNNLDYSAGKFNAARVPRTQEQRAAAKSSKKEQDDDEHPVIMASRPSKGTRQPVP